MLCRKRQERASARASCPTIGPRQVPLRHAVPGSPCPSLDGRSGQDDERGGRPPGPTRHRKPVHASAYLAVRRPTKLGRRISREIRRPRIWLRAPTDCQGGCALRGDLIILLVCFYGSCSCVVLSLSWSGVRAVRSHAVVRGTAVRPTQATRWRLYRGFCVQESGTPAIRSGALVSNRRSASTESCSETLQTVDHHAER